MHAFIRKCYINYFIISDVCKFNIINTFVINCMKIFVITVSNTMFNCRIYLVNEWLKKFIFFNNNIFVLYTIHLLKGDFIAIKNSFQ